MAIAGFWKPSSIRITLARCDRAKATPSIRSRATTTGNRPRQHQRLVADIGGNMPRRIDLDRSAQPSAIAAAEHHRRLAEIAQQLGQRQHRRGLAGAADVIIADAKHGNAGVKTLALQALARNQAVEWRRAASAIAISMMAAGTRRPAHALAAPISSRNCSRYGSSAASVRSSAPPSCSTTRSAAVNRRFARRRIGQQLAELLHQRFLRVGLPGAAGAVERLVDVGEIEDVRAMNDRRAELDRLDRILPAMFDQRSAHEHDRRQPIEQSQFAHGVGDVDVGGRRRQLLARTQAPHAGRKPRWCGRWLRRDRDAAARSRSTATGRIPPASGAPPAECPLRRDGSTPRRRSDGRASPPSTAPAWRNRRAAPEHPASDCPW